MAMGPRYSGKLKNCDRVITDNRRDADSGGLRWRDRVDYSRAHTRAEGRVGQGGAAPPYIVCKTALKAYYDKL